MKPLGLATSGIALAVLLSGCAEFDETGVDYSGPYDREVGACASVAMAAKLRNDDGPVATIWARNITAEVTSEAPRTLLVQGETQVRDGRLVVYDWSCDVTIDLSAQTLTAQVTSFELVQP
ncbi:MAG: hypothetical protein JWR04_1537 [Rhodoglobus sp.]|jgi:hypothetical protein|nr:hypothetical protein [Rhodoglobus sp.]